jgi:hypothetical protein
VKDKSALAQKRTIINVPHFCTAKVSAEVRPQRPKQFSSGGGVAISLDAPPLRTFPITNHSRRILVKRIYIMISVALLFP